MSENISRRALLAAGSALAATGGVILSANDAPAKTALSTPSFSQLATARAVYRESNVPPFGLDMTWLIDQEPWQTLVENSLEITDGDSISPINLVSALLQVSQQDGDGNLIELARRTDASDEEIQKKAENILEYFPYREDNRSYLRQKLSLTAGFRSFEVEAEERKQAILVESDGDRFVLSPVVASTCSFLDWVEDTFFGGDLFG